MAMYKIEYLGTYPTILCPTGVQDMVGNFSLVHHGINMSWNQFLTCVRCMLGVYLYVACIQKHLSSVCLSGNEQ